MTVFLSVVAFVISLPLAVSTLAGLFGIIDQANKATAVRNLSLRAGLVMLLLLLLPDGTRIWVGAAFLTVAGLHAAAFIGLRKAILSGRWITERHE